jgi:hypothetical protein
LVAFDPPIYSSDVVLTYRLSGSNSQGDIWEPLPETYYFNNGTLDFIDLITLTAMSIFIWLEMIYNRISEL